MCRPASVNRCGHIAVFLGNAVRIVRVKQDGLKGGAGGVQIQRLHAGEKVPVPMLQRRFFGQMLQAVVVQNEHLAGVMRRQDLTIGI